MPLAVSRVVAEDGCSFLAFGRRVRVDRGADAGCCFGPALSRHTSNRRYMDQYMELGEDSVLVSFEVDRYMQSDVGRYMAMWDSRDVPAFEAQHTHHIRTSRWATMSDRAAGGGSACDQPSEALSAAFQRIY